MLSFKNVTYKIKNKTILNNITFHIKDKEKVLIVGESGCGKSTIFNLIIKNITPSNGAIYYNKKNIQNYNNKTLEKYRQNDVIIISQADDLFDYLTVYQNLNLFYHPKDIEQILKKANLYFLKNRYVFSLSGGERQRIAIVKACLSSCKMLLCDEITSALDQNNASKIIEFILSMFKDKTILFITHDEKLFSGKIDHYIKISNHTINDEIFYNELTNKRYYRDFKIKKNLYAISFKNGLKNLSITSFIIYFLSIITIFVSLNISDIFLFFAKKSYENYFNYDVLQIKDYQQDIEDEHIYKSLDSIFSKCNVFINDSKRSSIKFSPFFNKDNKYSNIVINQLLLNNQNIETINSILIHSNILTYSCSKIDIIDDKGLYNQGYIYYDIRYFTSIISNIESDEYYIVDYDFLKMDKRFTNNPLFIEKEEKKPYLDSNAYKDYLTFEMVFSSIKEMISYFFVMIFLFTIVISILLNVVKIMKDLKSIAIYSLRGYSNFSILLTYLLPIVLYFFLSLTLPFLIKDFILPILITFLLQIISCVLPYFFYKRKNLSELLKEDTLH